MRRGNIFRVYCNNYIESEYSPLFGYEMKEGESNLVTPRSASIAFRDHHNTVGTPQPSTPVTTHAHIFPPNPPPPTPPPFNMAQTTKIPVITGLGSDDTEKF